MKRFARQAFLPLLLLAVVIWAGFVLYQPPPCVTGLPYSVGRVDEEFELSREEYRAVVKEAVAVWEKELGRKIFHYDPEAELKINLIFDERQQFVEQSQEAEQSLKDLSQKRSEILNQYEGLTAEYQRAKDRFEELSSEYQEKLSEYNSQVQRWNSRGGVPAEQYQELEEEQEELEALEERVLDQQTKANSLAEQLNRIAKQEQGLVEEYNERADSYQERYGQARQFEQGRYTGGDINVFQFNSQDDLRLVLVHELGHALGMSHTENSRSVMYELMRDQTLDPITLTDQDRQALRAVCEDASLFLFLPF